MSAFFVRARKKIADADLDFLVQTFRLLLIDMSQVTQAHAITNATNATPIVVTSASHGLSNGDFVDIHGVGGNLAANGHFLVGGVSGANFNLLDPVTGASVAGSGAYTSGGYSLSLEVLEFIADLAAGAVVSRTAPLASKTTTRGIYDCADTQFAAVPTGNPCSAMMLARDSGSDATSELVTMISSFTAGMPVTPNGGNIDAIINALGLQQII